MKTYNCESCGKEKVFDAHRKANRYCSIQCQMDCRYKEYITEWLSGNVTGTNKNGASKHIKRYILEKQNNRCAKCNIDSWNNNPIVLELEHKDGNSQNNSLDNLECLCPNCHSQTPTYKNRNQGNGRHARRIRYAEGKSF